ncbi:MAG: LPS-assembly protein LptD [Candidatus Omnitrophica bacterium]|nr:LPS-assembly protein LptD [Candidatus Omnitrophota bacterium]
MDAKSFRVNIGIVIITLTVIMTTAITGTGFCDSTSAPSAAPASSGGVSIELNGDTVEYSVGGNKLIARGNVVIYYKEITLTCDRLEFSRDTSVAHAEGHIHLTQGSNEFTGEKMTFNFQTMQGEFEPATIFSNPYYGKSKQVAKVDENHIVMKNGYLTTCDLDDPHYRLISRTLDIYPKDKMVARSVRMKVGKVPLIYLPRFTQDLTGKRPLVTFTPGYDKQWGMFLLTAIRADFNDNVKGTVHFDAREKKDVASGFDVSYKTPHTGSGTVRTYYMNERSITSRHFYQPRPSPTIERERLKAEWRHKWDIDEKTNAIWQYYKLSDNTLLKEYFEREFDKDGSPATFFSLTRNLPAGVMSFRTDKRVNRFEGGVERLPELRYDLSSQKIGETNFYVKDTTIYSNLSSKQASPTEVRLETMRLDTDNELSYSTKLGIFELRPFVGGEHTYYSKTKDPAEYNAIRGIFRTGASLSTKFFRVFDVEADEWGLDIHRLRHIITPSASYSYNHRPTFTSNDLDSFDGVDGRDVGHSIGFSLENKLQTKRNGNVVDLLRAVIGTNFALKENPGTGGFNTVTTDIDFRPVDRVTFYFDSSYDTRADYLTTANFDMYINGGKNWWTSIGKRWNREVDDQVTTEFGCKINPKWAVKLYNRFDVRKGLHKEQQYTLTRDLHEWSMDINFNETRASGDEIWIVFTLKAFPEMALDLGGAGFNKRKAGSQTSGGN